MKDPRDGRFARNSSPVDTSPVAAENVTLCANVSEKVSEGIFYNLLKHGV